MLWTTSCTLCSLFHLHKQIELMIYCISFCRRPCLKNMPCDFHWLGAQCCCLYSCFSSSSQRTWLMLFWLRTFSYSESLLFRMFSSLSSCYCIKYLNDKVFCFFLPTYLYSFYDRATLIPSITRFLPKHWNEDVIKWRFPYFSCQYFFFHALHSLKRVCVYSTCYLIIYVAQTEVWSVGHGTYSV